MRNIYRYILTFVLLTCSSIEAKPPSAVTYTLSGGRFGDNLLSYLHAKWISFKYDIPLLYQPFPYSDQLLLHIVEKPLNEQEKQKFNKQIIVKSIDDIEKHLHSSTLFILPYYPEAAYERSRDPSWSYIPIDWNNEAFCSLLKKTVQPTIPLEPVKKKAKHISVACHLRKGTGFDSASSKIHPSFVLKFPPDAFFVDQINWLLRQYLGKKLFIYIFTDDPNPKALKKKFEKLFKYAPITFACRKGKHAHDQCVLDDFFAMTEFDCCIHGASNFSICAGILANFKCECVPASFRWQGDLPVVDAVDRMVR